jgi:hypothetical protein
VTRLVQFGKGNLLSDIHIFLRKEKESLVLAVEIYGPIGVRQTEIHATETLVSKPIVF